MSKIHGVLCDPDCQECAAFSIILAAAICRWDSCRANMAAAKPKRKPKNDEQEELDLKSVDNAPEI